MALFPHTPTARPRQAPYPRPRRGVWPVVEPLEERLALSGDHMAAFALQELASVGQTVPGGGTTTELGSIVNLYISNGQPPKAQVPSVVGLPEAAARSALSTAGFNVAVTEVPVADPAQDGLVLSQQPRPGVNVVVGSTVTISVGKFSQPSPPPPPPSPPPSPPPTPTPTPSAPGGARR